MRAYSLLTILSIFIYAGVSAQTQDSYDYNSEFIWGINKNSSSGLIGGFVFKKARKISENSLESFGLEIMNVRHPQEVRKSSGSGNFFIYGKSNYLYSFRLQYGRDFILFHKAPQHGVEIKAVFAAGPSVGVVAPYYIERSLDGGNGVVTVKEQYNPANPNHKFDKIIGNGGFFYGIGESKIQMGGNLKAALNFETGVLKSQVTGFEIGFLLDAYTKKVILVPTAPNRAVYPTIFLTLFYGTRK
jgi:hypothetical protein